VTSCEASKNHYILGGDEQNETIKAIPATLNFGAFLKQ